MRNVPPDVPPATGTEPAERPYKPSPLDYRYLSALREVIADPGHSPRAKLAQLTGVTRTTIWRMEADERRMAWVAKELAGTRSPQWEQLISRAWHLAMKGNVEWARFFGQAIGKLAGPGTPQHEPLEGGTVVWVNRIPRPDPSQMLMAPVVGATTGQVHGQPPVIVDVLDLTR